LGLRHDIGTAWRGGPRLWGDVLTATWELARANIAMRRLPADRLALLEGGGEGEPELSQRQRALVERVAYVVPIMGLRLPWRADCLVQALAGQRWLARGGVPSRIRIGVRKDSGEFGAHAWLTVGARIVTGGDVTAYAELPPGRAQDGARAP